MKVKSKQTPKVIIGIICLEDPPKFFSQTFSIPSRNSPTGAPQEVVIHH